MGSHRVAGVPRPPGAITGCWLALVAVALCVVALSCSSASAPTAPTTAVGGSVGGGGSGAAGGFGGTAGAGGGPDAELEALLAALRADRDGTLQSQSERTGWPTPVQAGHLFVSTDPALTLLAGEHDGWTGTPMIPDSGFHWLVLPLPPGARYKFSDGQIFQADPWSRSYEHDALGIMSLVPPSGAHLERHFAIAAEGLAPRTVRVWRPDEPPTHVLYAQDGQNLFDPEALWGGWRLLDSVPPAMMIVAIDNTPARVDEYTHVPDLLNGQTMGGQADAYAALVHDQVRELIRVAYGEPPTVGLLGSSLGGLVSFHIALRYPGAYHFAASLSGTMGWGSIGLAGGQQEETMIERYADAGHQSTALYLDSGGNGNCVDADGDGIEDDDPNGFDNYCENRQLEQILYGLGYVAGVDVWHWWEPDAPHNELAWADRVWRPLELFAAL